MTPIDISLMVMGGKEGSGGTSERSCVKELMSVDSSELEVEGLLGRTDFGRRADSPNILHQHVR